LNTAPRIAQRSGRLAASDAARAGNDSSKEQRHHHPRSAREPAEGEASGAERIDAGPQWSERSEPGFMKRDIRIKY